MTDDEQLDNERYDATTLREVASWLSDEYDRLAPYRNFVRGKTAEAHDAARLSTLAELEAALKGWAASGRPPQHSPDWRGMPLWKKTR